MLRGDTRSFAGVQLMVKAAIGRRKYCFLPYLRLPQHHLLAKPNRQQLAKQKKKRKKRKSLQHPGPNIKGWVWGGVTIT